MNDVTKKNDGLGNEKEQEFLDAYKLYADSIYRHCYFGVYNKDIAEDLTQETFIKTWKYLAEGKEIKNIKSFLYRVAVNLIIDYKRKKKPVVLDDLKEKEASLRLKSMEKTLFDSFNNTEIIETLNQLNPKYRQVIVLRYVNELSPAEIAKILGESANAVSVRLNYALKKLREILKAKYHEL